MSGIQIVLVTGILFLAIYFVTRTNKRIAGIVFMLLIIASAIIFILWPDLTNQIAHKMGVGRGADLLFYLSFLLFWFVVLKLYIRIRRLERAFTDLVRKDALDSGKLFEKEQHEDSKGK